MSKEEDEILLNPKQSGNLEAILRLFRIRGISFPEDLFLELLHGTGHLPIGPDPLQQRRVFQFAEELEKCRVTELADKLFIMLTHYDGLIEEIKGKLKRRLPHVSNK